MKVCDGCPDRFKDCVQLDPDQSLPENPYKENELDANVYKFAQEDMFKAGFRRVIKWISM